MIFKKIRENLNNQDRFPWNLNFKGILLAKRSASYLVLTSYIRAGAPQLTFGTLSTPAGRDEHLV